MIDHSAFSPSITQGLPDAAARKRRAMQELELLRAKYVAALPAKMAHIETIWLYLKSAQSGQNVTVLLEPALLDCEEFSMSTFYRLVHNLAGSGASYGLPALSQSARELTNFLKPWSDPDKLTSQQPPLKPDMHARIEALLLAMRNTI